MNRWSKTQMRNIVRFTVMVMLLSLTLGSALAQDNTDDSTMASDTLDQSARWLMIGIEELDALEDISDDERESVRDYLLTLIDNPESRIDKADKAELVSTLQSREAVAIVERAFVRVSAPVNYHEGYWIGQTRVEGVPVPVTTLNDIHVDAYEGIVTVYGQAQVGGEIIAPVQVGEGEVAEHFGGNTLGIHPNAVYLNGSGEELTEADGTGSWWIKHAIIGSPYYNWPLLTTDYSFGGQFTHGFVLEDSATLMMRAFAEGDTFAGFPVDPESLAAEIYGNTRHPGFETDSVTHIVTRYEPANVNPEVGPIDYTSTEQGFIVFECSVEPSPFNGQTRTCPTKGQYLPRTVPTAGN